MTIMATHFAIVLGAWRLRVRIDLDEPRQDACDVGTAADDHRHARADSREPARPAAQYAPRWN
ncbi:MAG: hypothetical protein QOF71_3449 [Candidatus Eremiobacteraeota bacterium]|jgi:hypothetical protein|nr:hypothetical protein [Candidatus Eremiobacteraeota bacterium]